MTGTHPFIGEGFSYEDGIRFWDEAAEWYSARQQGDIPGRTVRMLTDRGILGPGMDVLELGSGPGTYSVEIAPAVRGITCVDASPRMIARLTERTERSGIGNMTAVCSDFNDYRPEKRFDTVVSALCPGTGSESSILKMESYTSGTCVHIMWLVNSHDDLNAEIWKLLGKDYSFEGRKSGTMEKNLSSLGREYTVDVLDAHVEYSVPFEQAIAEEMSSFRTYGEIEGLEEAVRAVLEGGRDGGTYTFRGDNSMKIVCWHIPGEVCRCP